MPTATVPPVNDPHHAAPAASFRRTFWAYVLGVALLLLFGGLIWMVVGRGAAKFVDVDQKREQERYKIYDEVTKTDKKTISDPPAWVDQAKGTVRLPLAQAMSLTLEDLQTSKPRAAYPVAATDPAPAPAPPTDGKPPEATGQPPTTVNANNPVLPKQPDAAASAPTGAPAAPPAVAPSPSPTPEKSPGGTPPQ